MSSRRRSANSSGGFCEGLHNELDPKWNSDVIVIQPGGVRRLWAGDNMIESPSKRLPMDADAWVVIQGKLNEIHRECNEWKVLELSAVVDDEDLAFLEKLNGMVVKEPSKTC
ncbi:hypothetical protein OH77DRAFT_1589976 [Trametes cingulata]|nr:hypothetical protein OH77DRAFT_1589976 [Trametes cingulata]